ncbi:MAG: hypothetical protein C0469_14025 [Cyanobacteria bacterium DS2.3.42]|nr:hypothetical protein [Cyanobacteria bacterium DS2.3.42]
MKQLDSGSSLWNDHAALSPAASFDDIFAREGKGTSALLFAKEQQSEPETLSFPSLFEPVENKASEIEETRVSEASEETQPNEASDEDKEREAREERKERRERREREEKNDDWFKGACDWLGGAVDVATQVVVGAAESVVEAVTERPMETLGMLAGGVAIGVCIGAALPVAGLLTSSAAILGGVTLATDAVVVGLTAMGAAHAGHSVIKAVEESSASADILMNKSEYSIAEIDAAREQVQGVTGAAAIEAGFTLTMAGLSVGNGVRLVKGAGDYLKVKPASVAEKTLAVVDEAPAMVTETAQTSAKNKFGSESEKYTSADERAEVMDEVRRVRRRGEAMWFKSAERAPGSVRELPLDTAPEVLAKIDRVIEQREATFDVGSAKAKYDALESKPDPEIIVSDSAGGTRTLTKEELYKPSKAYELLKDTPQMDEYDAFLSLWRQKRDLTDAIERELNIRRMLVEDALNSHAQSLFPNSVVPKLSVRQLDKDSTAEASYGRGDVRVKDEVLYKPTHELPEGTASRTIDSYVHEMTHGEQDGLMIRNFIDIVTGGDTSVRPLTPRELDAVVQLAENRIGARYPKDLVEDINVKRSGRVLRQEEVIRAEKLEASDKANRFEGPRHREERAHFQRLKDELESLESGGDVPPEFFSAAHQSKLFEGGKVPEMFETYSYLFENLLRPNKGNYNAEQQALAANLKDVITGTLDAEKTKALAQVYRNQGEYRGWYHEREAWRIGEQAGMQVTEKEIMSGDRMQNWIDAMTRRPVDYSDVLAY